MPQLLGPNCLLCKQHVAGEASYCKSCHHLVHADCAEQAAKKCPSCGGELAKVEGPTPIAHACPSCGSKAYKAVQPTGIAFRWDRVCKTCKTKYTPPTPLWGRILFVATGLLLLPIGPLYLWAIYFAPMPMQPTAALSSFCGAASVLGVGLIIKAFWPEKVVSAPAPQSPQSP